MMNQFNLHMSAMRPPIRQLLPGLLLALGVLLGSTGCIYRMTIQQGNFLDATQVAQLETGMTRSQVAFLLGTPMVPNAFDSDRWDYFYYLKERGAKHPDTRRVTVYFENDKVARVEKGPDTGAAPHIGVGNRS